MSRQRAAEVVRRYVTEVVVFRLRDGLLVDYQVISDALTGFKRMGADVQIRSA